LSATVDDARRTVASDLERMEELVGRYGDLSEPFKRSLKEPPPYIPPGGKLLRPRLVSISARLCGYSGDWQVPLGCAVELLHNASLFHDDVIDGARMRRGAPSINVSHSNRVAILAGDLLFTRGMELVCGLGDVRLIGEFVRTMERMVSGEIVEMSMARLDDFSYEKYIRMIDGKTASLIALCLKLGALLCGDARLEALLEELGYVAGRVFQIADDLLDYLYSADVTGKDRFRDYYEGKPTYPASILYEQCSDAERAEFLDRWGGRAPDDGTNELLASLVARADVKERVEAKLRGELERAVELAEKLPQNPYREMLEELTREMAFRVK